MKPCLPLTAGVLSCGLGGVDVVRLLAGAVRAGLNRLRVSDDAHSTDLRSHSYNLPAVSMLKLTEILLEASCLMGGVGVTVTPGGMLGLVV